MRLKYKNGGSVSSKKSEFDKAFEAARRAGQETFMFDGKSYATNRADSGEGASIEDAISLMLANPETIEGVATANPDQDFRSDSMKLYGFEQPDDGPIENLAYAPEVVGGFQGLGVKKLTKSAIKNSKELAKLLEAYLKKQPLGSTTSNIRRNVLARNLSEKANPKTFEELAELRKVDPTLAYRSQVREAPPVIDPILDAIGIRASRGLPQSPAGKFGTKIYDKLAPLIEKYYKTNP
tara:strand:- start:76 stop:786 length:711 start_codon:yes stop_codon:yes gene_type:complete